MRTPSHRCQQDYIRKWAQKYAVIQRVGGKCQRCGEGNIVLLEFHHLQKRSKTFPANRGMWEMHGVDAQFFDELKTGEILCRRCHQEERESNSSLKIQLLKIAGSDCCSSCGYRGKNLTSLEFHHRNRNDKMFNIGTVCRGRTLTVKFESLIDEVKKCDVLCSNCHALKHFDMARFILAKDAIEAKAKSFDTWRRCRRVDVQVVLKLHAQGLGVRAIAKEMNVSPSTISSMLRRNGISRRPIQPHELKCKVCHEKFTVFGKYKKNHRVCCSHRCSCQMSGSGKRPSPKKMRVAFKVLTMKKVALKFGVDLSTVYRWCERYHIVSNRNTRGHSSMARASDLQSEG